MGEVPAEGETIPSWLKLKISALFQKTKNLELAKRTFAEK
jgi:hypothetical protein